jgi:16S rRNA processing protein RimM
MDGFGAPMADRWVTLGRITGIHGVRGWVRVQSFTRPTSNLFEYGPWLIRGIEHPALEHRASGRGFVVRLAGVDDRELAGGLVGEEIQVARSALPEPEEGAYYWADLVGLEVICESGESLGRIDRLLETGAQDVMVIKLGTREHLVPFVQGPIVRSVDMEARQIVVRWESEY